MTIQVSCVCGKQYQVDPAMVGQQVMCQACGSQFVVTAPAADPLAGPMDQLEPLPDSTPTADDPLGALGGADLSQWEQAAATDTNALAAQQAAMAQSRSPAAPGGSYNAWRDGSQLVVCRQSRLPHVCVRTNAPAESVYVETLNYIPVWMQASAAAMIVITGCCFGPCILFLLLSSGAANPVGSHMNVEYGVSNKFMIFRYISIAAGVMCLAMGAATFIVWLVAPMDAAAIGALFFLVSPPLWMAGGVFLTIVARPMRATYVDPGEEHMWISGPCEEFLARFPQWQGGK